MKKFLLAIALVEFLLANAVLCTHMAGRPKEINPKGDIKRLVALVPFPVAERLEREAKTKRVSVAQIVREKLEQVA